MKKSKKSQQTIDSSLKKIVRSSFFVFICIILSKFLAYLYRIIIARNFGPETYGVFSLTLTIMVWATALSAFGFEEGILRFSSFYHGKKDYRRIRYLFRYVKTILLVTTVITTILLFLLSGIIGERIFHNPELKIFLRWFSLAIPFFVFSYIFINLLKSFEKIEYSSLIEYVFQSAFQLLVLYFFWSIGFGTTSIILSYILGGIFLFAVAFYILKKQIPEIAGEISLEDKKKKKLRKELFHYSWPLILFSMISTFFYWIDSLVIGYFKGAAEVGFYNAAAPIAALLFLIPVIFIQMFFPLINKEYAKKNIKVIRELSKQVSKWILILNLPIFIIMFAFPGALLSVLFGKEYIIAENALRFLSLGAFFSSVIFLSNHLISMAGKSKLILFNMIIASVLNTGLCLLLVPKYGIDGAAVSTAITSVIFGLLFLFQSYYFLSIVPLRRKMLRIILVSIFPALVLAYIRKFFEINIFTMSVLGVFFLLVYLILVILVGGLDRNDLMIISTIKKKLGG